MCLIDGGGGALPVEGEEISTKDFLEEKPVKEAKGGGGGGEDALSAFS